MSVVTPAGANIATDSDPTTAVAWVRLIEDIFQMQIKDGKGLVQDFKTYDEAVAAGQAYADQLDAVPIDDKDRAAIKALIVAKDEQIKVLEARIAELEAQVAGGVIPADIKP